jgi:hypothetical protein
MLDAKLQIKPGHSVEVTGGPESLDLAAPRADGATADAVLVFVRDRSDLEQRLGALRIAADAGRLTWVAYPKAGQLSTDLNRDVVREIAGGRGLDTVRQIAVDDT